MATKTSPSQKSWNKENFINQISSKKWPASVAEHSDAMDLERMYSD